MAAVNYIFQQATTLTASGQSPLFGSDAKWMDVSITTTAVSGTTPTLSVQLQIQGEDGSWTNLTPAPSSITATGTVVVTIQTESVTQATFSVYRFNYVTGGTTPSFTSTVSAIFRN